MSPSVLGACFIGTYVPLQDSIKRERPPYDNESRFAPPHSEGAPPHSEGANDTLKLAGIETGHELELEEVCFVLAIDEDFFVGRRFFDATNVFVEFCVGET